MYFFKSFYLSYRSAIDRNLPHVCFELIADVKKRINLVATNVVFTDVLLM